MKFSTIRCYENIILPISLFCMILSAILFCRYVWDYFVSPIPDYSNLSMIEGKVMQKKLGTSGKYAPDVYRLWVMTDTDERQLSVVMRHVSNCCFLEAIPLFEKVTLLAESATGDSKLYQLTHQNKVILDGHDVLLKEREEINENLYAALILFFIGGATYIIGIVRKLNKNT